MQQILHRKHVATNIADVQKVAQDLNEAVSEIETVANDLNEASSEIDTVGQNIANVNCCRIKLRNYYTCRNYKFNKLANCTR